MTRLSKEQLLLMHEQLIDRYGGSHGIRDEGLLDSALATPFQSFRVWIFIRHHSVKQYGSAAGLCTIIHSLMGTNGLVRLLSL